jgi:hypothetical protein
VRAAGARLLSRAPAEDGSTVSRGSATAPLCLYDEETCSWGETLKLLARPQLHGPCEPHAALQMCIYKHSMLLTSAGKGRQPKHVWHVSSKWLSDTAFAYMVAPLENYIVVVAQ